MIIGNGLIANSFAKYFENDANICIFASGTSNSKEISLRAFEREEMIVADIARENYLTYFSTCSVADPELRNTPYVRHKMRMESIVRSFPRYSIFRLPQVVGKTPNPHTLTNYLYKKISDGTPFQIWTRARRNLIDVDDVACIGAYLIRSGSVLNSTVNIACPYSVSITYIVDIFENVLHMKANYKRIDVGGGYEIETRTVSEVADILGINFNDRYIYSLISKYYKYDIDTNSIYPNVHERHESIEAEVSRQYDGYLALTGAKKSEKAT